MTFQPLPPKRTKFLFFSEQPTIIRYKKTDMESVNSWTNTLDDFLKGEKTLLSQLQYIL